MSLRFCPIKGCWRLRMARVEYNDIVKTCCKKHVDEVMENIRQICKSAQIIEECRRVVMAERRHKRMFPELYKPVLPNERDK